MRTTVTLDADVERMLKNDAHAHRRSFKVSLNEAVRKAFGKIAGRKSKSRPFVLKARALGLRPGLSYDRLSELCNDMEVEAHLAVTARLKDQLRKR